MSVRFTLVPASYVFLRRGEQVLLQLRRNTGYRDGYWACAAAGHVEAGESMIEAAVRELDEELGVDVAPADLVPLTVLHRTDGSSDPVEQRVDFMFGCTRWRGEPVVREPHKCAGLQWFSVLELPELVPPHERLVLERLASGTLAAMMTMGFET